MPISLRGWSGTKDAARWPLAATCSQIGCYFTVCAADVFDAEKILHDHEVQGPCPYGSSGVVEKSVPVGKSLREMQWDRIDECVRTATNPQAPDDLRHTMNGMVQGLAYAIFLLDQPYWESENAVLEEAAKRHRIATGQQEFSPTPGYHYPHHYSTIEARLKGTARPVSTRSQTPTSSSVRSKVASHPLDAKIKALDEKKVRAIVRGLAGGFPPEQMAEMYKLPLAMIRRIAAQPERFAGSGK